jgi:uncharacterized membrane protein YhaH (DUF805 family)
MDASAFLFGFKGRIGRSDFWLLMLTIAGLIAGIVINGYISIPVARPVIGYSLLIAALAVFFAAASKRLHDRDKSAWYLFLFFGVPSVLQAMSQKGNGKLTLFVFSGGFDSFIDVICLAISVWMIVELGCLRGSIGANKFGPDPLQSAPT